MKTTLQVLLQLRGANKLARFAIGGAVAASFYIEAAATEDLDISALRWLIESHGLQERWDAYARRYA